MFDVTQFKPNMMLIRELLKKGGRVDLLDEEGCTGIQRAADADHKSIVVLLREENRKQKEGRGLPAYNLESTSDAQLTAAYMRPPAYNPDLFAPRDQSRDLHQDAVYAPASARSKYS